MIVRAAIHWPMIGQCEDSFYRSAHVKEAQDIVWIQINVYILNRAYRCAHYCEW